MKLWFVVSTKPRNENRAAGNLVSGGIEALNPKLRIRKFKDGKFVYAIEPMFPNYIFVRFDPVDEHHMVKYTRGVRTIVNFSGKLIPLEDEVIDFIKSKLENGVAFVQKKGFEKGDKVFIKDGPFKGLNGIFQQDLGGEERVSILLEGVNYYAKMEIDRDLIVSA
jgi:transcriptional antiterminator RfaH